MKKILLLILVGGFWLGMLQAQQRMQYSQYLLNAFLVNPAVGGAENFSDLRMGYSHQWAGFKGAPKGGYLSFNKGLFSAVTPEARTFTTDQVTSLPTRGRGVATPTVQPVTTVLEQEAQPDPNFHLGIGGSIFSESTGPLSISGLGGAISSHIRLKGELKLSIGAGLEMLNYRLDPRRLDLVNENDVAVADDITNLLLPSINGGFALYSQRFFVAGSTRQLLRNRIQVNPLNPVISNLEIHYVFQAGYRFQVNEGISLTPSAAFRYVDPAPPSFDLSLQANFSNQVYAGLSYRHQDALVGMIGLGLSKTTLLQYAFDFTLSNLRSYSAGTHSLVLGIKLGPKRLEGRRYFW